MKKLNMIFKPALIVMAILLSIQLSGQQFAERALYRDSFLVTANTTLEVINKYGSVHIKNWDKDSIQISTDVYLSTSSIEKLERLKHEVKIDYSQQGNRIVAQTTFRQNKTSFLKDLQDFTRSLTTTADKRIEINYEIFVPKGMDIDIKNQYGDITLGDVESKLRVELSNGSFKANDLKGPARLKFSFVNAMINTIKDGDANLNFSNLNLNKAISLNFSSTVSELYADEIGMLKIKSSRDKINVGKLSYLYGSANYTRLTVSELYKELDCYFTYGQIDIDDMNATVSLIDIDSERTDIKLFVPKNISYKYDILYHIDADLLLPEKDIKPIDAMEMEEMKSVKGKVGQNPTFDIRIRALKRCLVQIQNITTEY